MSEKLPIIHAFPKLRSDAVAFRVGVQRAKVFQRKVVSWYSTDGT